MNNKSFTIENFESNNSNLLINLFIKSVQGTAYKDYKPSQIKAWSKVDPNQWHCKFQGLRTWVAKTKTTSSIVGFISLKPHHHIEMLYVHPAYQHIGIATQLLKQLESWTMLHHIKILTTDASITAKSFFEKHQFTIITPQQVHCRGEIFTNFQMQKIFS